MWERTQVYLCPKFIPSAVQFNADMAPDNGHAEANRRKRGRSQLCRFGKKRIRGQNRDTPTNGFREMPDVPCHKRDPRGRRHV